MTNEPSEVAALTKRLTKLEKENRVLKQFGLVTVVLAAVFVVMGQARPQRTVEAERFVLKDDAGRTRAEIVMDASHTPSLRFFAEDGARESEFRTGALMFVAKDQMADCRQMGLASAEAKRVTSTLEPKDCV